MSKRFLVLSREKGGSNLFASLLLGARGTFEDEFNGYTSRGQLWLPTAEEKQCRIIYNNKLNQNTGFEDYVKTNDPKIDELFFHPTERTMNHKASFYDGLPGEWKFIFLFRDPRTQITSWYRRRLDRLGREKDSIADMKSGDKDSWLYLCNRYVVNGCKSVVEKINDPRFLLIRYEDLVKNPLKTIIECFDHMGFKPDMNFYPAFLASGIPVEQCDELWSDEQEDIFMSYVGEDFLKLYSL